MHLSTTAASQSTSSALKPRSTQPGSASLTSTASTVGGLPQRATFPQEHTFELPPWVFVSWQPFRFAAGRYFKSGWPTVCVFLHLWRTHSGYFQFLLIMKKDAINNSVQVCMLSLSFPLIWVKSKKYKSVSGFARNRRAVNRRGWTCFPASKEGGFLLPTSR